MSVGDGCTRSLTDRSRVLDVPNIFPRNADVLARTEDFAG